MLRARYENLLRSPCLTLVVERLQLATPNRNAAITADGAGLVREKNEQDATA